MEIVFIIIISIMIIFIIFALKFVLKIIKSIFKFFKFLLCRGQKEEQKQYMHTYKTSSQQTPIPSLAVNPSYDDL